MHSCRHHATESIPLAAASSDCSFRMVGPSLARGAGRPLRSCVRGLGGPSHHRGSRYNAGAMRGPRGGGERLAPRNKGSQRHKTTEANLRRLDGPSHTLCVRGSRPLANPTRSGGQSELSLSRSSRVCTYPAPGQAFLCASPQRAARRGPGCAGGPPRLELVAGGRAHRKVRVRSVRTSKTVGNSIGEPNAWSGAPVGDITAFQPPSATPKKVMGTMTVLNSASVSVKLTSPDGAG